MINDILKKINKGHEVESSKVELATHDINLAKSLQELAERYKSEMKGTANLAKSLGLEIPNSTLNNMKFIDMFITNAKAMSNVADQMEGGLKKITGA